MNPNSTHADALVFFGATGDLAYKKIFPALQAMVKRGTLNVPVTGNNASGTFPGNPTSGTTIPQTVEQIFSSGLATGQAGSTTATITGILTDPNFQVVLHALESRTGVETLGEPEITVISGRQTQMRATSVVTVVIGLNFQQGQSATTSTGLGATP